MNAAFDRTLIALVTVLFTVNKELLVDVPTVALPKTFKFSLIAVPPDTIKAPVVVDVELVVPSIVAVVATTRPFLTLKSICIAISFPFH
jgi:hypothetical protein